MLVEAVAAVASGSVERADALLGVLAGGDNDAQLTLSVAVGAALKERGGSAGLSPGEVFEIAAGARAWAGPGWPGVTAGLVADVAESAYRRAGAPDVAFVVSLRAAVLLLAFLVSGDGVPVECGARRRLEAAGSQISVARELLEMVNGDVSRALLVARRARRAAVVQSVE